MKKQDIEAAIRYLDGQKAGIPAFIRRTVLRSLFEAAERRAATSISALPEIAPKLYANRPKGQTIVDFLRDPDGWGPYVAVGRLSRPEFRHLDPQGEMALRNWLRANRLPNDVIVPTKTETVDADLEAAKADEVGFREASRLVAAQHRRRLRQTPKGP